MYARLIRLSVLFLLVFMASNAVYAQSTDSQAYPTRRKPLRLDTMLVDHGKATAIVVCPDAAEYTRLALRVSDCVREATGTPLPLRKDSEYAALRGELRSTPETNLIVLGNQDCSGLVTYLCLMSYCAVDTVNPGKDGYVIRTIHDPWGNGVNVIALLGSNFDGVRLAVDRFCSTLPKGTTLSIPRTIDTKYSAEMLKGSAALSADPTDEQIAKQLADVETAFRRGQQGGLFGPVVAAGNNYAATGHEGYAKLFRDTLFLAEKLTQVGQGPYGGQWGAASDFLIRPMIIAWDNVEESPSLSDADRSHIVRILLDYIHYWEARGYTKGIEKPALRTNHSTFEGQGWLAAGQYFAKYYDTDEGARLLQLADWCFGLQMKSFKPREDCGMYQYIILRHIGKYAVTRQDFGWFDTGKAQTAGDLAIMCMDNLGYEASFGDVHDFGTNSHLAPLQELATVDSGGRWAWAIHKSREAIYGSDPWGYPNHRPPSEPTDLLGVKCMPTDPLFYDAYSRGEDVPQERTFEKITFRTSFDPDKPYLLLDGLSGCYHGHYDGNSILRFTDRDRIWLADCDYIKSLPKFHNTMLIFRDGQSTGLPTFSEREVVADLPSAGMTRTTTHDYGGMDWSRNIIWDRDRTFVVFDEVQAKSTGEYSARCYWQTLGTPKLDGSVYRVSQDGPSFTIRNLDGARLRYVDDPVVGQNWRAYKHAEPVIHTLQQIRSQRLPTGGRICIAKIVSTEPDGQEPIQARRVNDTCVLVGSGSSQVLIGVNEGQTEIVPGVTTDARMYRLTRDRIALGGVTRLAINGRVLLQSDEPVDKEVILPRGFRFEFPVAMPLPPASGAGLTADAQKLNLHAQYLAKPAKCTALTSNGGVVYVCGSDGLLHALDSEGHEVWSFDAGSSVRAVWAGKLQKEGPVRVAVGTVKSMVYLLDEKGGLVWKNELPYFKQDACVVYLMSADLAGDGNRALIVGAENWRQYAFDASGKKIWEFEVLHASTAGTSVDLDGDGREEVIAGSDYYHWYAVNPDGKQRFDYYPIGPRTNCIVGGDVGWGKRLVLFGGADGYIHAVDAEGKRQWLFNSADEITGLALVDVDADGTQDIVAGSLSFDVSAVKGDGTRIWRTDVGEPVSCLILDEDGRIWVGTEDGHVLVLDREGKIVSSWAASGSVRRLCTVSGGVAAMTDEGVAVLTE